MDLYYNFFVYEGEWLRSVVLSILNGRPEVPMYSFELGYGADVMATMGGCLNDPFNLVSIFCFPEYAEYVFEVLIFLRFIFAAIAFSLYSFSRGRGYSATFFGSLCYVLCGYMVFWGVLRHPNFLNFAILLPLILWGSARILERKSPYLFIIAFALLFSFSLYFAYMMLIITVVYCLLAFFLGAGNRSVKRFLALFGQFVLYTLISFLLVAIIAVPIYLVLSSMGRLGLERDTPIWETFNFYWGYGANLLGGNVDRRSLVIGAIPFVATLAFFSGRKIIDKTVWRPWAAGVLLCVLGSMVPFIGSAFNGFGYVTDRWLLILGFCVANTGTLVLPKLREFHRRQWLIFGCLVLVFGIWCLAYAIDEPAVASIGAIVTFAIAACLLLVLYKTPVKSLAVMLSALLILCTGETVMVFNSSLGSNYASEFVLGGKVQDVAHTVPFDAIETDLDDSYRVDRADFYWARNQAFASGVKGVDFFSSYYNQNVDDARNMLGLSDNYSNYVYNGLGGRFSLQNLMGARYFITNEATKDANGEDVDKSTIDRAPFGYEHIQDLENSDLRGPFRLYESKLALPIAFTYRSTISSSDFSRLSMLERQEVLTKACVLEDDVVADFDEVPTKLSTVEQSFDVIEQNGLSVTEGGVEVLDARGSLVFEVKGVPDAENYIVFENLGFSPYSLSQLREITGNPVVLNEETGEIATEWDELKWAAPSRFRITARGGGIKDELEVVTSTSNSYGGKTNWVMELGYSKKPVKRFRLSFSKPGVYTWDKFSIATQPIKQIEDELKQLKSNNKASIDFSVNRMNVTVAAEGGDEERYVFVSIPFSDGWSVTLDGRPVDILKANTGFMAVAMNGDAHELIFTYRTPGLIEGAICSMIGLLCVIAVIVVRRLWINRKKGHVND